MGLRLERIVSPHQSQLDELYAVCCKAPNYWRLTEGKLLPGREAVFAWFDGSELPPGRNPLDQHIYGVREGDELIGVVMVLRGWRYPEQAMIGLLLLAESRQGLGIGREVYAQLEDIVRAWPGIVSIRIGIIASNTLAFPFWRKMGFVETGERKRDLSFLAETIILEKPLPVRAPAVGARS